MKKRILLLDDEMDFVDLMKATLELTGRLLLGLPTDTSQL